MLHGLKSHWNQLKDGAPGERFARCYEERRARNQDCGVCKRCVGIAGAVVLLAVGIIMMPAPGPGWPIIVLELGLLANECGPLARFLDRVEVRGRAIWNRATSRWQSASAGQRRAWIDAAVCVALVALCGAGLGVRQMAINGTLAEIVSVWKARF